MRVYLASSNSPELLASLPLGGSHQNHIVLGSLWDFSPFQPHSGCIPWKLPVSTKKMSMVLFGDFLVHLWYVFSASLVNWNSFENLFWPGYSALSGSFRCTAIRKIMLHPQPTRRQHLFCHLELILVWNFSFLARSHKNIKQIFFRSRANFVQLLRYIRWN